MTEINVDNLKIAYNQIVERIIEVTAEKKPNYEIDGQIVSWADYLESLNSQLEKLKKQIDAFVEPFEIEQQIYT